MVSGAALAGLTTSAFLVIGGLWLDYALDEISRLEGLPPSTPNRDADLRDARSLRRRAIGFVAAGSVTAAVGIGLLVGGLLFFKRSRSPRPTDTWYKTFSLTPLPGRGAQVTARFRF